MQLEQRLSALLQIHLHYLLNTWLKRIRQRQLQDKMRNIWVLEFGATYIWDFTVHVSLIHVVINHFLGPHGIIQYHHGTCHCLSGKLWYLQHNCVGDTFVFHKDSDVIFLSFLLLVLIYLTRVSILCSVGTVSSDLSHWTIFVLFFRVAEILEAKGANKNGRFQGRANKLSKRHLVEKLIQELCCW